MEDIKVIVNGIGAIGGGIVEVLSRKKGVKIVGALDCYDKIVGKDVGVVAGVGELGVTITNDPDQLYNNTKADVVLNTSSPTTAEVTYEQVIKPIDMGMNIIVANMACTNLFISEPELANKIDKHCKSKGVSFVGLGATQATDRLVVALTEGSTVVKKLKFTHYADLHAFGEERCKREWGTSCTIEEFNKGIADGSIVKHDHFKSDIMFIAAKLGWDIDDITMDTDFMLDEKKIIKGITYIVKGLIKDEVKLQMDHTYVFDPERKYFDRIQIDGVPMVDAVNNFSPNRGFASTIASIANAIPHILKASSGYVNSLDLPACHIIEGDYRNHL